MSDLPEQTNSDKETNFTPRPLYQRVLAWLGIAYVLITMGLIWFYLIQGVYLQGIGPLLLSPIVIAFGVMMLLRYRSGVRKGGLLALIVLEALVVFLLVYALADGIPNILAQL